MGAQNNILHNYMEAFQQQALIVSFRVQVLIQLDRSHTHLLTSDWHFIDQSSPPKSFASQLGSNVIGLLWSNKSAPWVRPKLFCAQCIVK